MTPEIERKALRLQRSLGTRVAAGFLRNRGVQIEMAVALLATRKRS